MSLPIPAEPVPSTVQMAGHEFPFTTLPDVVASYRTAADRSGLHPSRWPSCRVLDQHRRPCIAVGYKGSFAIGPDGFTDYGQCLHRERGWGE